MSGKMRDTPTGEYLDHIEARNIHAGNVTVPFTPTAGVKMVNSYLEKLGFEPRDADGNDYANPTHPSLRFKTGCSMGEVTTQIVRDKANTVPIRATSWAGIDRMMLAIGAAVDA